MAPLDLSRLSPATRRLVQDARYRAQSTSDLLQSDPSSLESALARDAIDAAVVEILTAAGLPRGPINGLIIESFGRSWHGRKMPDCRLFIDPASFLHLAEGTRPDSLLRTWIHESLHARHPYALSFSREWQTVCGFEEGLVEGLTQMVTLDGLGLRPITNSYPYYVSAYRTMAAVLELEVEQLWREFWWLPAGEVASGFIAVVERILQERNRAALSRIQHARISAFAARFFDIPRTLDQPDIPAMIATWRRAIE